MLIILAWCHRNLHCTVLGGEGASAAVCVVRQLHPAADVSLVDVSHYLSQQWRLDKKTPCVAL